jgi:drug/metabolite transporter (DMT)-like permease
VALLVLVSIIWALSFGLIKQYLTDLDPTLVAFLRMLLSLVLFLPFLKIRSLLRATRIKLIFTGMVQFGIMYIAYILSYQHLQAYQVALFTVFTPLYVTLVHDVLDKRFHLRTLGLAGLAVAGCAVIVYQSRSFHHILTGFLLVQLSNFTFAAGQIAYRRIKRSFSPVKDYEIFGLLYLGAVLIIMPLGLLRTNLANLALRPVQIWVLIYLGVIASGICFFLWNRGITMTGVGNVAILNNLKIPLAVLFSTILFRESVNVPRLLIGFGILGTALFLNHRSSVRVKRD